MALKSVPMSTSSVIPHMSDREVVSSQFVWVAGCESVKAAIEALTKWTRASEMDAVVDVRLEAYSDVQGQISTKGSHGEHSVSSYGVVAGTTKTSPVFIAYGTAVKYK